MNLKRILVVAAVLALASCAPAYVGNDGAEPGAELFARAERNYRAGAYREALKIYNEYLTAFPSGIEAPTALFREAEIYRAWKDYRNARTYYQHLIDHYGGSHLVSEAIAGILRTLYDEKRHREVIQQADAFFKRPGGVERPAGVFVVLGDTYMALKSPANAVYFYAKALERVPAAEGKTISPRLKSAVASLSVSDILELSERVTDARTRGYLIYALGVKEAEEKRYADASRTLSQFIEGYPEHEYSGDAKRMLKQLSSRPVSGSGGGPYVIGCLLPLTGSYGSFGKKALRAVQLAVGEAGPEGPFRILVKDTRSDATRAAEAVAEMARENVTAIIGPIISAPAAAPKAQAAGIPIIVLTQKPDITRTGEYVFRNFLTPQMQARSLVTHAMEVMGLRRFAILYPREKYGTVFLETFTREVKAQGGELAASQSYGVKTTDFSAPIQRLRQYSGIDALFIPEGPEKSILILPQLASQGLSEVQLLGTNLWNSEKLIRSGGRYAQGAVFPEIFFPDSPQPEVQGFVRSYTDRYGEPPGFIEALAYDAAMMLMETVPAAERGGRAAVREALSRIQLLRGVTGATEFDETGDAVKKLELLKINGDHVEPLGFW